MNLDIMIHEETRPRRTSRRVFTRRILSSEQVSLIPRTYTSIWCRIIHHGKHESWRRQPIHQACPRGVFFPQLNFNHQPIFYFYLPHNIPPWQVWEVKRAAPRELRPRTMDSLAANDRFQTRQSRPNWACCAEKPSPKRKKVINVFRSWVC